jgi:hypothetical protein
MWSSSRMMLPEHVEAILEQNRGIKKLTKPELDEHEIAMIDQAIYGSMKQKRLVTLTMYDEYEWPPYHCLVRAQSITYTYGSRFRRMHAST